MRTCAVLAAAVVLAAAPAPVFAQYDYSIGNVTAPAAADAGAWITLTAVESSAASAPLARSPWVTFYLANDAALTSGRTEICTAYIALAPGATQTITCNARLSAYTAGGTYFIGAIIDPRGWEAESDEQNNLAMGVPIQITHHLPDYTVGQLAIPPAADAGATITVSAVESAAAGASVPSHCVRVTFYLARDAALTDRVATLCTLNPQLATGTSTGVSCSGTISGYTPSGTYYVGAVIDPDNLAAETDEQNNVAVGVPIQITYHPPDFTIAQVSAPARADVGAMISLSAVESAAAASSP